MGRKYEIPIEFTYNAANAPMDALEIVSPSDAVTIVHEIMLGQADSETSEAFDVEIYGGYTTSGSGGSTVTPDPLSDGDAAYGGTVETGNTTQASTAGTKKRTVGVNALSGWHFLPTPETRPEISPSQRWVVALPTDPTNAVTIEGYAIIEEVGG